MTIALPEAESSSAAVAGTAVEPSGRPTPDRSGRSAKRGRLVPFPTLFGTLKDLEKRAPRFTIVLASGLAILMIHLILYPWPASIPDTNRLHQVYECHPIGSSKQLSKQKQEECRKLDEAELRPSAGAP